ASTPVLCPRAGGNLIQTRITRLNDFLLQRSRASSFVRAPGEILFKARNALNDFPFKAAARGRALPRLELFLL
ncbi:hypothetical protein, partial [uncultured Rikenella sp.]|uniref:hypothetical protein n=1 Tax=uncultured Rikenella sp. TaxID=368003 RepID=UPI00272C8A5E